MLKKVSNISTHQTYVLMKTSWRRLQDVFCLRLQKTSSKQVQDEYICLSHTSSEDVFKTSWLRPIYSSWPYVFKTSSKRLAKTSSRHTQDVFKTSLRRLPDLLQRYLEDVFNMYHQTKLFLLTSLRDLFSTFLRLLQRRLVIYRRICLGHTSEKFMVIVQNLQEW